MPADSMKPIPGVAVIRLASMEYAVEPTAVRRFNLLANLVRWFVVVMPEQNDATQ